MNFTNRIKIYEFTLNQETLYKFKHFIVNLNKYHHKVQHLLT